jgi:hypothetical protein
MLARVDRWSRISGPGAIVAAAVLASLLLLASTGLTRAASRRCGAIRAQTLASDRVARVYATAHTVYGCATGSHRSFKLGTRRSCAGTSRAGPIFVLVARLAAYGLSRCGVDTGFTQVVVRRLTDGAQLRSLPATGPVASESFQTVNSIALRSDDAVAWIGTGSSIVGGHKLIEVHKADRTGAKLLDSGAAIDSMSLRLHGSKLTWKHGGAIRSATLQ